MSTWSKLKMDFVERFLNFETAKGIYLVPAGFITIYVSIYYIQYLFIVGGCLLGWYLVSEGLRKVFVNRFAQERIKMKLRSERYLIDMKKKVPNGVASNTAE